MKKTRKLTREEHAEIGANLKSIRIFLIKQSCKIQNTYGKTKKIGKLANRAFESVDSLICELDNQCYMDLPGEDNFDLYYGPNVRDERPGTAGGRYASQEDDQ